MYKMLKVFDCQEMPDDVRVKFFEQCQQSNDCYVGWWPESATYVEDDGSIAPNDEHTIVDAWLLANGADPYEQVLIKHWW